MRHPFAFDTLRILITASLAASSPKIEQLRLRLQMGYDATKDARSMISAAKYEDASRSYADALNFGRKPALALQELQSIPDVDSCSVSVEQFEAERHQAMKWLVDVFCESCQLHLNHLDDPAAARANAWAACIFSQYQARQPLVLMKQVCQQDQDLLGEMQMCQALIKLPIADLSSSSSDDDGSTENRETLTKRLEELDLALSQKL